jgi:hypothetical protein
MRIRRDRRAKSGLENLPVLSPIGQNGPTPLDSIVEHQNTSDRIVYPTAFSNFPIRPGKRRERRAIRVLGVSATRQKPSRKSLLSIGPLFPTSPNHPFLKQRRTPVHPRRPYNISSINSRISRSNIIDFDYVERNHPHRRLCGIAHILRIQSKSLGSNRRDQVSTDRSGARLRRIRRTLAHRFCVW